MGGATSIVSTDRGLPDSQATAALQVIVFPENPDKYQGMTAPPPPLSPTERSTYLSRGRHWLCFQVMRLWWIVKYEESLGKCGEFRTSMYMSGVLPAKHIEN